MLWKDEACPEIEKPAEIKDPRFKSISTQVTEGADEDEEINSEESSISSDSNEDEDDEINSEESSIYSDSNEDGWETFSNESDSIETENEENVNEVGLTDEENSSLEKNNAEKETTKVNANEKEKGLHTGRKSTSKEKKRSNIQKAKNRNSRSYRERVSPLPPSPVLADIIFQAPSIPTQPLQANLHPVVTAEKKKELKKKETEKVPILTKGPKGFDEVLFVMKQKCEKGLTEKKRYVEMEKACGTLNSRNNHVFVIVFYQNQSTSFLILYLIIHFFPYYDFMPSS
jgi:hypothetical protein